MMGWICCYVMQDNAKNGQSPQLVCQY